jgi:hypothetical protein
MTDDYTEDDLARIARIRASGVASATQRDETTTFRSDAELQSLERELLRKVRGKKRKAYAVLAHNRGT